MHKSSTEQFHGFSLYVFVPFSPDFKLDLSTFRAKSLKLTVLMTCANVWERVWVCLPLWVCKFILIYANKSTRMYIYVCVLVRVRWFGVCEKHKNDYNSNNNHYKCNSCCWSCATTPLTTAFIHLRTPAPSHTHT